MTNQKTFDIIFIGLYIISNLVQDFVENIKNFMQCIKLQFPIAFTEREKLSESVKL